MKDFGSSARYRLSSSTAFLVTCLFLSQEVVQGLMPDFTQAVVWTTYSSTNGSQVNLLYPNPSIPGGGFPVYAPVSYTVNSSVVGIGALDMLYSRSCAYYSLDMKLQFSVLPIPQTGQETLQTYYAYVPALSSVVTGISVDWVSELIYWSDALYQRICVINNATYGSWRLVVDTNLTSPQGVVVYPQQSLLFWSDLGDKAVIERFDLKTDDRRILLSSPTLQRPTKLVVDFANQRLFWLDASAATIGSMNFDGSSISFWSTPEFSSVSSFAFFRNNIFIGKNDENVIYIYDSMHQYQWSFISDGGGVVDMTAYSKERNPPVDSPCTTENGGCAQLCITVNSTQRRCLCGMGLFLASNEVDCATKPMQIDKFLIVSDQRQCNIFQISVETGEVRALTSNEDVQPQPTAIAFDPLREYLYYFDKGTMDIRQTSLNATVPTSLPNVTIASGGDITSLAFDNFDPEHPVLFYVDYLAQKISAMHLSNLSTITIYSQAGSRPRTIVLDTSNRLLYWSDCGYNTIERGSKTNPNTNRMTIISGLNSCAMTFAIDFKNQKIFWADASGSIETAKLDGTARSVIIKDSNAAFTGLSLDAQFIYVAASNIGQIRKIDRNTKQLSNLTKILFTQPFALLYYSNDTASTAYPGSTSTASSGLSTLTPGLFISGLFIFGLFIADNSYQGLFISVAFIGRTIHLRNIHLGKSIKFTIIILASVISGAVVLIAIAVTVGIVVAKRRRAASAGNSLAVVIDNSRPYETLNAFRHYESNPQVFNNESYYAGGIPSQTYVSIK